MSLACCGAVVIVLEDPKAVVETKADRTVLEGKEPVPLVPTCGEVGGVVGETEVILALAALAKLALLAEEIEADELDRKLQNDEDETTHVQALDI